jgi:hypothetical protein
MYNKNLIKKYVIEILWIFIQIKSDYIESDIDK